MYTAYTEADTNPCRLMILLQAPRQTRANKRSVTRIPEWKLGRDRHYTCFNLNNSTLHPKAPPPPLHVFRTQSVGSSRTGQQCCPLGWPELAVTRVLPHQQQNHSASSSNPRPPLCHRSGKKQPWRGRRRAVEGRGGGEGPNKQNR